MPDITSVGSDLFDFSLRSAERERVSGEREKFSRIWARRGEGMFKGWVLRIFLWGLGSRLGYSCKHSQKGGGVEIMDMLGFMDNLKRKYMHKGCKLKLLHFDKSSNEK